MITLYDFELSGDCYKVRLMLSLLGLPYETVAVDVYPGRVHESDWFLALNPLGELPVLAHEDRVLRGSHAILVYLARRFDATDRWFPVNDPTLLAEIESWHGFAEGLTATAAAARLAVGMFVNLDLDAAQAGARRLFRVLDEHLWFAERAGGDWLCRPEHPTTADLACFPPVALSEEGDISRQDYPAIRRWMDRVRRIPGFTTMSGIFPAGPAFAAVPGASTGDAVA